MDSGRRRDAATGTVVSGSTCDTDEADMMSEVETGSYSARSSRGTGTRTRSSGRQLSSSSADVEPEFRLTNPDENEFRATVPEVAHEAITPPLPNTRFDAPLADPQELFHATLPQVPSSISLGDLDEDPMPSACMQDNVDDELFENDAPQASSAALVDAKAALSPPKPRQSLPRSEEFQDIRAVLRSSSSNPPSVPASPCSDNAAVMDPSDSGTWQPGTPELPQNFPAASPLERLSGEKSARLSRFKDPQDPEVAAPVVVCTGGALLKWKQNQMQADQTSARALNESWRAARLKRDLAAAPMHESMPQPEGLHLPRVPQALTPATSSMGAFKPSQRSTNPRSSFYRQSTVLP